MWPNPHPPDVALLRPECPLKLAAFSLRILVCAGQQGCLAHSLKIPVVGVRCIQQTRSQGSSSVIRLSFSPSPLAKFHLRLSRDM